MKQNDIQRVLDSHISVMNPGAPDPDAILNHIHTKRRASLRKRRTLLLVVTLLIATMVIAQALGFPILQKLIGWQEPGIMTWRYRYDPLTEVEACTYTPEQRATWGDMLCDLLEEHGFNVCLPSWKPEGYELSDEIDIYIDDWGNVMILFSYVNADKQRMNLCLDTFTIDPTADECTMLSTFELNEDEEPKIFNVNGHEIWWGKNIDTDSVFWTDVSGVVSIMGGPFGDKNVERMIQSISPD